MQTATEPSGLRLHVQSWETESPDGYQQRVSKLVKNFPDVEIVAHPYLSYEERDEHTFNRVLTQSLSSMFRDGSIQAVVEAVRLRKPNTLMQTPLFSDLNLKQSHEPHY
jgi:hypothetical protein